MKKATIRKYTDYFLLFFLVATTGFPFFYEDIEFVILGFLFSFFVFLKRKLKFSKRFIIVFLIYLIVELFQGVYFSNFEIITTLGTIIRILFAFFCATILKVNFFKYYYNLIYFFAVISLLFYFPIIIDNSIGTYIVDNFTSFFEPPFTDLSNSFYAYKPNIIFFCFEKSLFVSSRNSGPFWEPGAFSIFLIIALLFNIVQNHKIFTKKNIVLIIAVLTTTSTSGYITLFIGLVGHFILNKKVEATKYAVLVILIYGASLAYIRLNFLNDKANEDIELASETTTSRFGSALVDLKDFAENPIIGYGRGTNRYGGKEVTFFSVDQHRNNGITQLLVTYGIIIFIMYFYFVFLNFRDYCKVEKFNKNFAFIFLFVLLLLGFSQGIFTRAFFYSLLFLNFNRQRLKHKFNYINR